MHPCISAKMKKSPTERANNFSKPYSEIHFDISGSLSPSIGGKIYAAHFMEPITAKTYLFTHYKKSELAQVIISSIKMVESHFTEEGYRVTRLRCDGARENYPAEVQRVSSDK